MSQDYEIYARVFEIKEIKKTLFIWLVSRNGLPSFLNSKKGTGPDCGGTVLNNKSLEVAVKEMDSEIDNFITREKVTYRTGNPPWEGPNSYKDTYGLASHLEQLNMKRTMK